MVEENFEPYNENWENRVESSLNPVVLAEISTTRMVGEETRTAGIAGVCRRAAIRYRILTFDSSMYMENGIKDIVCECCGASNF